MPVWEVEIRMVYPMKILVHAPSFPSDGSGRPGDPAVALGTTLAESMDLFDGIEVDPNYEGRLVRRVERHGIEQQRPVYDDDGAEGDWQYVQDLPDDPAEWNDAGSVLPGQMDFAGNVVGE